MNPQKLGTPRALDNAHRGEPVRHLVDIAGASLFCLAMAVPYLNPSGVVFAGIMALGSFFAFLNGRFELVLPLVGLWIYQCLVCILHSGFGFDFANVNSSMITQCSIAILGIGFLLNSPVRRVSLYVLLFISAVAFITVSLERVGLDFKTYIPSRYESSLRFSFGSAEYEDGAVRLRGVYPEASAVGASMATIFGAICIIVLSPLRRYIRQTEGLLLWVTGALCALTLLQVLTKSGVAIAASSLAFAFAVDRTVSGSNRIIRIVGSLIIIFGLASLSWWLLPAGAKSYFEQEVGTLKAMQAGAMPNQAMSGRGMFARWEGMELAAKSLVNSPLGASPSTMPIASIETKTPITTELIRDFADGIFGLKCSLANNVYRGGIVSLSLLAVFIYQLFFRNIRRKLNSPVSILKYFAVFSTIGVWLSIEDRYYYLALPVLLYAVVSFLESRVEREAKFKGETAL